MLSRMRIPLPSNLLLLLSHRRFSLKKPTFLPNLSIQHSKLNPKLNAFVIYQCPSPKKFQYMSIAFLTFIAYLTGVIWLIPDPIYSIHQKISLGIVVIGLLAYQWKLRMTLRRMLMDGRGERVRLEFYDWLGWGRKVRDIEIAGGMEGVRRLHNRVRVPTFRYRYGEKSYMGTFSSAGIVEPLIFPSIMSGKCIKVFK